jgi:hypothetical protein
MYKSPKKSKRKSPKKSKRKSPKKSKRKSPKKSKRKSPKKSQMKDKITKVIDKEDKIKKVIYKEDKIKKVIYKEKIDEYIKKKEEKERKIQFIKLCKKHIMKKNLDYVYHQKHLSNNDEFDIYLLGEEHEVHNESSTKKAILDMFKELVAEKREKEKYNDVMIDLMIEIERKSVIETIKKKKENDIQMFQVRDFFMPCLRYKSCGTLHVHWLDHAYGEELENRSKYNLFPAWYKGLLLKMDLSSYNSYFSFKEQTYIIDCFNPDEKEKDIKLLLIENPFIQKEILHIEEKKRRKKNENNDQYKKRKEMEKYIKKFGVFFENIYEIFFNIYKKEKEEFMERKKDIRYKEEKTSIMVYKMLRYVMDFYTILRIINLNLKNVIIYAGEYHTRNIENILTKYCNFHEVEEM